MGTVNARPRTIYGELTELCSYVSTLPCENRLSDDGSAVIDDCWTCRARVLQARVDRLPVRRKAKRPTKRRKPQSRARRRS